MLDGSSVIMKLLIRMLEELSVLLLCRYGFIKYKEKTVADKAMETLHQQSLSQFPENKVGVCRHVLPSGPS